MATTKKTTKPKAKASSKAKPKSSSIGNAIKTAGKAAIIPGYGGLTAAKAIDDYIQKKDPNLSKSKTYNAVKQPAKKVKGAMDYISDKAIGFAKGAADVVSNPGKYIEKGAAKIGKAAGKGMKAVDDYIEKADPNLTKSKLYGAIKGTAKKVPKNIEKYYGMYGKVASMATPFGGMVAAREVGKKVKQGAKAADDYVQKNDPNLSKSKLYGAVKGAAKSGLSGLGVKSGSTSKKAAPAKASASKPAAKTTPAKTTAKPAAKTTPAKPATTTTKSAPSVSELWKQKTGTSWSEAKKQGLSDGSASSNVALMKKLQSGSVNKNTVKTAAPGSDSSMKSFEKEMNKNVQDELSGKIAYAPPAADENKMRRGGMVRRRMQAGGAKKMDIGGGVQSKAIGGKGSISDMTPNSSSGKVNGPNTIYAPGKKKTESTKTYKTGGSTKYQYGGMKKATTMNPTSRNTAMTALGVKKKNQYSPSKFDDNVTSYARGTGTKKMKTGGMVNSNSKVSAIKSAGSKGVKTGANTRISASKIARGRVGGTSTAPRTAAPKAKMGMSVRRKR